MVASQLKEEEQQALEGWAKAGEIWAEARPVSSNADNLDYFYSTLRRVKDEI